ncbi:putative sulfate exporter family transporter [Elizabethkingia anophelis]|uniref:YeiH family protein n=1 Tax=Elizabethkingia anophelis TaxID=1117645 RepID=UPI00099B158D|nr:putative sulfate exporter family transporter [Elizabethkingia anophelis]MDV3893183.1 putative sulfate exporter family transporter [Elizabethkingia anophelis]MDV3915515.1 putative sulfate exporter family transporter [Elizabethkingia anophelis]MDV3919679.1 putative sulfate exporter family transporter [Elizabethkingia anophelis]MDV3934671.1 putative sulfate exporter family transporter [Elizabethkingia anophelis]MDV3958045.1 putative sulfate exporter family transporter [Elizabethkingia anopheli
MKQAKLLQKILFFVLLIFCVTPFVEPPLALILGFVVSFFIGHPYIKHNSVAAKYLLQFSVVGLGFGMNLTEAIKVGKEGLIFTVASIFFTLIVGLIIGRYLKINKSTSTLISGGTAICGGSAIAALAPVINAKDEDISVAMACIFILNALALLIFSVIGHQLNMSQDQFGLWSAIAIHDTSSVIGSAQKYGEEALKIATTVKLERALWIIPVSILLSVLNKGSVKKIKIPYFILGFIGAILLAYYFPQIRPFGEIMVFTAKKALNITLFLIASGLSISSIKKVGVKPLVQGVLLWIFISVGSLLVIMEVA